MGLCIWLKRPLRKLASVLHEYPSHSLFMEAAPVICEDKTATYLTQVIRLQIFLTFPFLPTS